MEIIDVQFKPDGRCIFVCRASDEELRHAAATKGREYRARLPEHEGDPILLAEIVLPTTRPW